MVIREFWGFQAKESKSFLILEGVCKKSAKFKKYVPDSASSEKSKTSNFYKMPMKSMKTVEKVSPGRYFWRLDRYWAKLKNLTKVKNFIFEDFNNSKSIENITDVIEKTKGHIFQMFKKDETNQIKLFLDLF